MPKENPHFEEPEVPLSGVLAEFRTALRSEIEAASRNERSLAVGLLNGRRIGRLGSHFHYNFDLESGLNVPDDCPADLYVPGRSALEAKIIHVEGMAVTISLDIDIGDVVT